MYWFGGGFSLVSVHEDQQAIHVALSNLNVGKNETSEDIFAFSLRS